MPDTTWKDFFESRVNGHRRLVEGYLNFIDRMQDRDLPPIFEMRHLSELLAVDESFLVSVVQNQSNHYRTFHIQKRSGGFREISGPSPTLLHSQRWILDNILEKIQVNPSAHGFCKAKSVITNASKHLGATHLLKMDLKDFFPSVKFNRIMNLFLEFGYSISVAYFLARLCSCKNSLPQGAATSPAISNLVCRSLDTALSNFAEERNLTYTRYADDLTFSGNAIQAHDINRITWIIMEMGFEPNTKKTRLVGKTGKKIITGVSISAGKLALPRASVRQIKLEVHKILTRGILAHSIATNQLDPMLLERVLGKLNFWLQIDPNHPTANELADKLIAYRQTIG